MKDISVLAIKENLTFTYRNEENVYYLRIHKRDEKYEKEGLSDYIFRFEKGRYKTLYMNRDGNWSGEQCNVDENQYLSLKKRRNIKTTNCETSNLKEEKEVAEVEYTILEKSESISIGISKENEIDKDHALTGRIYILRKKDKNSNCPYIIKLLYGVNESLVLDGWFIHSDGDILYTNDNLLVISNRQWYHDMLKEERNYDILMRKSHLGIPNLKKEDMLREQRKYCDNIIMNISSLYTRYKEKTENLKNPELTLICNGLEENQDEYKITVQNNKIFRRKINKNSKKDELGRKECIRADGGWGLSEQISIKDSMEYFLNKLFQLFLQNL